VHILRHASAQICSDLLPEAIGLTDAFGFSDWELNRFVCLVTISFMVTRVSDVPLLFLDLTVPWDVMMVKLTKLYGIRLKPNR
jgi:hypothetical protein